MSVSTLGCRTQVKAPCQILRAPAAHHSRRRNIAVAARMGSAAGAAAMAPAPALFAAPTMRQQPQRRTVSMRQGKRINQNQFTEKAWQAILAAPQVCYAISPRAPRLTPTVTYAAACKLRKRLHVSLPDCSAHKCAASVCIPSLQRNTQRDSLLKYALGSACARHANQGTYVSIQVATKYSHQAVESEHLIMSLLEQSNGLARRILQKCDADPSTMLNRVDEDLRRLPKVSGNSDQILGKRLEELIGAAEELKAEWKDDYVSVEHLMVAAVDDSHYGQGLCKQFFVSKEKLIKAVKDIRGTKRVTGARCAAIESQSPPNHTFCARASLQQLATHLRTD